MKIGTNIPVILSVMIILVLCFSLSTFSAPPKKSISQALVENTNTTITVYCCEKAKIVTKKMMAADLKKNSSTCSTSKSKIRSICGVCCKDGKTTLVSSGRDQKNCFARKGKFYTSAADCKPNDVYCCIKGKVKRLSAEDCRNSKGKGFTTISDAKRMCKLANVFCCIAGKIKKISPQECRKNKGKAYKTVSEVKRQCKTKEVYCCLKGEVRKVSLEECRKKRGKVFSSKIISTRECVQQSLAADKALLTWCCVRGKVRRIAKSSCIRAGGRPYATDTTAQGNCGASSQLSSLTHQPLVLNKKKSAGIATDRIKNIVQKPISIPKRTELCFCVEIVGHGTRGSIRGRDARGVEWNLEAPAGVAGTFARLKIGHFYEICGRQPDRSVVIGRPFIVTGHTATDVPCREQRQCCINTILYPYAKAQCKAQRGLYYQSSEEAVKQCLPSRLIFKKPLPLPDLAILSTSVTSTCFLNITVENLGGAIEATDYAAAKIHLSAGPEQISTKTKLTDIDPSGALRSPGGSISYTSSLRITEPNQATLSWVDTEHAITESNETNNGDDAIVSCTKARFLSQLPPLSHQLAGIKKQNPALTQASEIRGISSQTPQTKVPEAVPKIGYRSIIDIESPAMYQTFPLGETITVRYRFTALDRDVVAGTIRFTVVHKGSGEEVILAESPYNPLVDGVSSKEVELRIPDDAPRGLYSIMADMHDSGAFGESHPFWINAESSGVEIILEQPYPGQRFVSGGMIDLKYYFSRPVAFGLMTFDLYSMESSTSLSSTTLNYAPPSDYSRSGYRFFYGMRIPPGTSGDNFFIVATHPNGVGTSKIFIIQPVGDGGTFEPRLPPESPASLFIGIHRGTGVQFHPGETIGISIEIVGGESSIPSFPSIGELEGGIGTFEMFLSRVSYPAGATSCAPFVEFYHRSDDGRSISLWYTLPSHSYVERLRLRAVYEGLEKETSLFIVPEDVTLDMAIPLSAAVSDAAEPAIRFIRPEPGDVLRNGSRSQISWEVEKDPGADLDLQTIVILRDESTGYERVLGNVLSASAGPGSNSRGHFLWHVGRTYYPRPGELGSRRRVDLDSGRYSIIARLFEKPDISAESGVFVIE